MLACLDMHRGPTKSAVALLLCCACVQSDANDKFNELEEQLQQIKDQIKVCLCQC